MTKGGVTVLGNVWRVTMDHSLPWSVVVSTGQGWYLQS